MLTCLLSFTISCLPTNRIHSQSIDIEHPNRNEKHLPGRLFRAIVHVQQNKHKLFHILFLYFLLTKIFHEKTLR
jgi:hypothetical protein